MSEEILFQDNDRDITVMPKLLKYRAQTFPTRNITNVAAIEKPFEFQNMLINSVVALIGIPIIFSFSWWSILGLAMVGLGVFNVKDIFTKKYIVLIDIQSEDGLRFVLDSKDTAITLRDALHQAMASN